MTMGIEDKIRQAALLMERAGLKPYVVAPKIGVSRQTLYDWLNGAHVPQTPQKIDELISYITASMENNESVAITKSKKNKVAKGGTTLVVLRKSMGSNIDVIEISSWSGDFEREAVEVSDFAMAPKIGFGWTAIYEIRPPTPNDVVAVVIGDSFSARALIGQGEAAMLLALSEGFQPIPVSQAEILGPIVAVRYAESDGAVHDVSYPKGMKHIFLKNS
jgi:hypothetical protein